MAALSSLADNASLEAKLEEVLALIANNRSDFPRLQHVADHSWSDAFTQALFFRVRYYGESSKTRYQAIISWQ